MAASVIDELDQCCGRCKWNAFDRDKASFYCSNPDSEYGGCYMEYQDSCDEYEVKDYEHYYKAAIDKTGQL